MAKRIFISKHYTEVEPIQAELEALGYRIDAQSFLSFEPVPFEIDRHFDVIFFGSPRAVAFFPIHQDFSEEYQLACVGDKTAEVLKFFGQKIDFKGSESGNPQLVAEEFKAWLGDRRVIFPISNRSLKTIANAIPTAQKEIKIAYRTTVNSLLIDASDIYVFTSPTNVEGFFERNDLPENSRVIAWGKSTETALISRAVPIEYSLINSSLEELLSYLKS